MLGKEDLLHKAFATALQKYEAYKLLNCVTWSYLPFGEKRNLVTASLLKSKGTKKGWADFLFIKRDNQGFDHFIWIEFKKPKDSTAKGKQSQEQIDFQYLWDSAKNSRYYIAYSVSDGVKILEQEGLL